MRETRFAAAVPNGSAECELHLRHWLTIMDLGSWSAFWPRSMPRCAGFIAVDQRFTISIAATNVAADAARWLCAELIGYRSLAMCGDARRLGIG